MTEQAPEVTRGQRVELESDETPFFEIAKRKTVFKGYVEGERSECKREGGLETATEKIVGTRGSVRNVIC